MNDEAPASHMLVRAGVFMLQRNEFSAALAIVASAVGADFVTGRVPATFYAQMGSAGWLGLCVCTAAFALLTGALAQLARRSGTNRLPELLCRLPGGRIGAGAYILYLLIVFGAICMLALEAGEMGALTLPVRHGRAFGMSFALLTAVFVAQCGADVFRILGCACTLLIALFEGALLAFGRLPEREMNYGLELRLQNNYFAAVLLGLLHASACVCLCAGATVRLTDGRTRPRRLGLWTGGLFGALLALGNAALLAREELLLALRLPFAALSSAWGSAGFYACAGLEYLACVTSMAGLTFALLRRSNMTDRLEK